MVFYNPAPFWLKICENYRCVAHVPASGCPSGPLFHSGLRVLSSSAFQWLPFGSACSLSSSGAFAGTVPMRPIDEALL